MRVAHLSLHDFRNYAGADVEFPPGPTLILGPNGQGKTNLVEAIAYFASLGSHRVSHDAALIRAGCDRAIMRLRVAVASREAVLELQLNRDQANRAQVNGQSVRARELSRWFAAVVFAPEDLLIVRGEPTLRRRFLDDAVSALNPAMRAVLHDLERVVRQRNALLKSVRRQPGARAAAKTTLEVWDAQLISLGARVMWERRRLLERLGAPLRQNYAALVDADHRPTARMMESTRASVGETDVSRETLEGEVPEEFVSRETLADHLTEALARVSDQEFERGVTLIGPQRDDVEFGLNGLPVRGFASHGESWSFALALRLSLAELLRDASPAGDPVIILDDVFAELDSSRRERLMSAVAEYEQVLITAAVEADVPSGVRAHRVYVRAGVILDGIDERGSDASH